MLFVNRQELDVLQKRGGLDLPDLLAKGIGVVVETRGGEGTLVHTASGRFAAPAVPATVRDPTGAGDAHRAGFLYALERGAELGSAARLANVLGSFTVEQVGAQEGHPTLQQALARYREAFHGSPF